jgi:DNA repair exonuclease SbcCD ATPase subunit
MAEFEGTDGQHRSQSAAIPIAIAVAIVLAVGSLIWAYMLQLRLEKAELQLGTAKQETAALQQRMYASDARLRATSETFSQRLGTTQAQIDAKAQTILQKQNLDMAKREEAEHRISESVTAVKTDVGSVKTDVTGVKTDVAATQADLATTKSQLQRTIGDAGVMSGLIARNSTELEELKHKGDRTYYEFTLDKNKDPKLMSSIKLQLKKVDMKKGRFTLNVNSDDRIIEKKDKTLDEPIQFYSGKTPALFEIVVNNIGKNTVSGYLSVPKGQ